MRGMDASTQPKDMTDSVETSTGDGSLGADESPLVAELISKVGLLLGSAIEVKVAGVEAVDGRRDGDGGREGGKLTELHDSVTE